MAVVVQVLEELEGEGGATRPGLRAVLHHDWQPAVRVPTTHNQNQNIQGESKVWIHPVTFFMDKYRTIKLKTPFEEMKVNLFSHIYYNFAYLPKMGFRGVALNLQR